MRRYTSPEHIRRTVGFPCSEGESAALSGSTMHYVTIRLKVALTTVITVFVALVVQSVARSAALSLVVVERNMADFLLPTLREITIGGVPVVLLFAGYLFFTLASLPRAVALLQRGESIDERLFSKARDLLVRLPRLLYIGTIIGASIGSVLAIAANPASLARAEGVLRLVMTVSFGAVLASVQIGIDDMILATPRRFLELTQFEESRGDRFMSMFGRRAAIYISLSLYLTTLVGVTGLELFRFATDANGAVAGIAGAMTLMIAYGIALGIVTVYTTSLGERSQIRAIAEQLDRLAQSDAEGSELIPITQFDEVGLIAAQINRLIENQRRLVGRLRSAADRVVQSSRQVEQVIEQTGEATDKMSASIDQVSAASRQNMEAVRNTGEELRTLLESVDRISEQVDTQASSVEQSSSAVHELAESVRNVAETTDRANTLADQSDRVAREGGEAVRSSLRSIHDIESASEKVNSIIGVISRISAQTNMLAMNAAIEAAHAGDAGSGFAVVAEEVRSLAADSAGSAREVSEHIKQMRSQVAEGVSTAEEAGNALDRIQSDIAQTSTLMGEIASAMREQNQGTDELLRGMTSLVETTESIRAATREQSERNRTIRSSLDELLSSFSGIQSTTENQASGTKNIVESFATLRKVAEDNSSVIEELQEISGGTAMNGKQ